MAMPGVGIEPTRGCPPRILSPLRLPVSPPGRASEEADQEDESGKRDSNPRPQPWQGCALPTELFPRQTNVRRTFSPSHGGEGNRTPDLLNAIQALSQLSYTPGIPASIKARQEPRRISKGRTDVKKFALAPKPTAGILQRFYSQDFFACPSVLSLMPSTGCGTTLIRSHLPAPWPQFATRSFHAVPEVSTND